MGTKTIMRKGGVTMVEKLEAVEEEEVEVENEDPQVPEEGEEVNEVYAVDVVDTGSKIILTIAENGKILADIVGEWKGRSIRAIPGVINKAFRQRRLQKYKELQNS